MPCLILKAIYTTSACANTRTSTCAPNFGVVGANGQRQTPKCRRVHRKRPSLTLRTSAFRALRHRLCSVANGSFGPWNQFEPDQRVHRNCARGGGARSAKCPARCRLADRGSLGGGAVLDPSAGEGEPNAEDARQKRRSGALIQINPTMHRSTKIFCDFSIHVAG